MQGTKFLAREPPIAQSRPSHILSTRISCLLQGIIRSYDTRGRDRERERERERDRDREEKRHLRGQRAGGHLRVSE